MDGEDSGEVESTLTSVYPYAKIGVNDRVDVWGMVGAGGGDVTLTQHADTHRARKPVNHDRHRNADGRDRDAWRRCSHPRRERGVSISSQE